MARDLYTDLGSNLDIAPVKSRIWMFEIREQVVLQRDSLCPSGLHQWIRGCLTMDAK